MEIFIMNLIQGGFGYYLDSGPAGNDLPIKNLTCGDFLAPEAIL
jgi:hypothetical protein